MPVATEHPLSALIKEIITTRGPKLTKELDAIARKEYAGAIDRNTVTYAVSEMVSNGVLTWVDNQGWGIRTG